VICGARESSFVSNVDVRCFTCCFKLESRGTPLPPRFLMRTVLRLGFVGGLSAGSSASF
jgi:hypothetical protein